MRIRVLICGGRNFCDWGLLRSVLSREIDPDASQVTVIHGGAKGADWLAKAWAIYGGHKQEEYTPDWDAYGKRAGVIRNQRMLDEGRPDFVIAFPGGRGTSDMVCRAKRDGLSVVEVENET